MGVDPAIKAEIEEFLLHEAELLDERRFEEWIDLFAEDARYEAPMRVTKARDAGPDIVEESKIFSDNRETLHIRVQRLGTEFAWAEDPPSRTRHFVTNIRVQPGDRENEYRVRCNLLVYRNRGDTPDYDLLSADRQDILRRVDGGWKIAYRRIVLDQSTVGSHNLSIFL
jgi:3-phenylpropionate/cinnamic acid dioxygenase small subunit